MSEPELSRSVRLSLYVLTIVLATVHVGQSIVLHSGVPGDLADARLVNCILEHIYQTLRGHGEFLSPSQFYPTKETLFYSDAHFGTAPIYVLFRHFHMGMARAFQAWFLTISAANTAALLFLLRRLGINVFIACPLAFVGTSSAALVAKAGHPQVLPFFPFIFALAYFIKFFREADARSLGISILWVGYQNVCYLYDGYFTFLIFAICGLFFLCFGFEPGWLTRLRASVVQHRDFLAVTAGAVLLLLALLYYPYARSSTRTGTRSLEELMLLSPNVGAWFTASASSPFYAHQTFYKEEAFEGENTLFGGWLVYLLIAIAPIVAIRRKRDFDLRLAAILAGTSLLVMLAITSWPHGVNLYLWLAERIQSIRAFRSFGRIAYLLIVMDSVAAALLLNHFCRGNASRRWRGALVATALLAMIENVSLGQHYYLPQVARLRAEALVRAWRAADFRDVLLFAPGFTNQGLEQLHLDCWNAALLVSKATVNGYSGNMPDGYFDFLAAPTAERAKALQTRLGLPDSEVSFVKDWLPEDKKALGIVTLEITPAMTIVTEVKELRFAPLETRSLLVRLEDRAASDLDCDPLHIYASYRLYDLTGNSVEIPPSLRTPIHLARAGEDRSISLRVQAPAARGTYDIRLSVVQEGFGWWADLGAPGSVVRMIVE